MRTHHSHQGHPSQHATAAPSGSTGPATATAPAVAADDQDPSATSASAEDIRVCAYRKWEAAGRPDGDGLQFWLEAEREQVTGGRR